MTRYWQRTYLAVFCCLAGPTTQTAPSARQRACVSGSRPRAKSAATTIGFHRFSTKAPTCGRAGGTAGLCQATAGLQMTLQSCPARCLCPACWRSLAATSVRGPTIRACWPPRSPAPRSWWRRPWRGEEDFRVRKHVCWARISCFIL